MWVKYLIIALLLFIAALLQASFFPYFAVAGAIPNLVFAIFFILIFFESKDGAAESLFTAVAAGFFLDMFLPSFIGLGIGIFLIMYVVDKLAMNFFNRTGEDNLVFYFIGTFCASFVVYSALVYGASLLFGFEFLVGAPTLVSLAYSLVFAIPGFYLAKALFYKDISNQLKLL